MPRAGAPDPPRDSLAPFTGRSSPAYAATPWEMGSFSLQRKPVTVQSGLPTWAALSAGGIRSLILPKEVHEIIIAADSDPVGLIAARAAARLWLAEGRHVSIARPPLGVDFNDL